MFLEYGFIKGGDLNNVIVYVDKEFLEEIMKKFRSVFKKDKILVKFNGIFDNLILYYFNEVVRYKLFDVIGDLVLVGMWIRGKVIVNKFGYFVNM